MARTRTNKAADKKATILASARKLFYEQGYNNTYLSHIAADCNISKQLLTYYYPSKAALANAMQEQLTIDLKSTVGQKLSTYFGGLQDLQVSTAVEIKLLCKLYLSDEQSQRFFRETISLSYNTDLSEFDLSFYEMHDKTYHLNLDRSKDELKMISRITSGICDVLIHDYSLGFYQCSETQLLDYNIELLYRLMHIDEERIAKINRMSNAVLELLDFQIKPYFRIEC